MRLSLFPRKTVQTFLTIFLTDTTVMGVSWTIENGLIKLLGTSTPLSYDLAVVDALVQTVDATVDGLGTSGNQTTQVLFALPLSWAGGVNVNSEKKHLLRVLCEKLNLASIGFVVIPEALLAYQRDTQETDSVCLYLEGKYIYVALVKGKKNTAIVTVGRSGNICADMAESLEQLHATQCPPHIIIQSLEMTMEELRALESEIAAFTWAEEIFASVPTATVYAADTVTEAVTLSGASEAAKSLHLLEPTESEPLLEVPSSDEALTFVPEQKNKFPKKKIIFALFIGLLGILLACAAAWVWIISTRVVEVTLVLRPQTVRKTIDLVLDPNIAESDSNRGILKASLLTQRLTDAKEIATSGKKITGEKAKGSIVIYNRTLLKKDFKAGTIVQFSPKISFVLDSDVSVASASSGTNYETVPGKITAKVTAAQFGDDHNIDKDVELSIGLFDKSAFIARSESAFSGGSSQSVAAVAPNDHADAVSQTLLSLKAKLPSAFASQTPIGDKLLPLDALTVLEKKFDVEVGKEAKTVSVNLTASASALLYRKTDVLQFGTQIFIPELPSGFSLESDSIEFSSVSQEPIAGNKMKIRAVFSAIAVPIIDSKQFAKLLSGKNVEAAYQFLRTQENIATFSFQFKPRFTEGILGTIPSQIDRIVITQKRGGE